MDNTFMNYANTQLSEELQNLYQLSVDHRKNHGCGGYSFEDGIGLYELVGKIKPRYILELGTALGYTSTIFARAAPTSHIDTIEADPLHVKLARSNFERLGISHQATVHQGDFQLVLAKLEYKYDLVFFDGFAPTINILKHLEELVTPGGHLICANLGLADTNDKEELLKILGDINRWKQVGLLENKATIVAQKKSNE